MKVQAKYVFDNFVSRGRVYQTFFFVNADVFFYFFPTILGLFIKKYSKHYNITAKIGNQGKTMFDYKINGVDFTGICFPCDFS